MLQKFQEHIDKNFPYIFGKKLLIAISGGVDSVVLTHLCIALNDVEVSLAHCNFKLRGKESDQDEVFVKKIGKELNLPTFTIQFDTEKHSKKNKLSTQLSARNLRYNWFQELIEKHQLDYVLTAHHSDDNLETFIINLTRGTGLNGLTGIPSKNGNIIRPILTFSRKEILKYAKDNNIEWREDATNSETKYLRNKIRHEIIPKLKEINPNLLHSFSKTTDFLEQSQQLVDDRIANISKEIISYENNVTKIDIKKILQLSNPKAYLYQFLKNYGFTEWNDVYSLLSAQSGKSISAKVYSLLKNRDFLLLLPTVNLYNDIQNEIFLIEEDQINQKRIQLSIENEYKLAKDSKKSIVICKNSVIFPLILRKWRKGDYFYPSGMRGKKKLSKFFKDEKLSILEKKSIWLLCSNDNEIIWVMGLRQDRRFLPSKNENNRITISIE